MNYVTKKNSNIIQNHLITAEDCEVTHEVFLSAATKMNNNNTKLSSKIISYQFLLVNLFTRTNNKSEKNVEEKKKMQSSKI